jgi:hypothetical protein
VFIRYDSSFCRTSADVGFMTQSYPILLDDYFTSWTKAFLTSFDRSQLRLFIGIGVGIIVIITTMVEYLLSQPMLSVSGLRVFTIYTAAIIYNWCSVVLVIRTANNPSLVYILRRFDSTISSPMLNLRRSIISKLIPINWTFWYTY